MRKQNYEPGVDEEKMKKLTGQAMVPVLISGRKSDSRLDRNSGLARRNATGAGALAEIGERPRASDAMGGAGDRRAGSSWLAMMITGRLLRIDDPEAQKSGKYFAEKYGHSAYAEEQSQTYG